jgi:hypothetical protein
MQPYYGKVRGVLKHNGYLAEERVQGRAVGLARRLEREKGYVCVHVCMCCMC